MRSGAAPRFGIALDPAQTRLVLEALSAQPYVRVAALIGRLDGWAAERAGAPFVLSHDELALLLQALGELPYRRVYLLIGSLRQQLHQLNQLLGEDSLHA